MTVLGLLLLGAAAVQSPAADSLRGLAERLPESALASETRARPLVVRDALTATLAQAVRARTESGRAGHLQVAQRLAAAYATAWADSFLVREVARFIEWPPLRRAAKVWVDSVRRSGASTLGRAGPAAAIAVWRRALGRASAFGDSAGMAAVLGNIGAGFLHEDRLDSAEAYADRARRLAASIGDVRVEANALVVLAEVSVARGAVGPARTHYARALALHERIGDSRGVAAAYNNLGLLAQDAGHLDEARRQFEAALALNRREGNDEIAATNLVNLAGLASLAGEFARAESFYRDALASWRALESWSDAADALRGLGQLELRRGNYPAARSALREALSIRQRTGPLADALAVRRELAAALAASGDMQAALVQLRRAQADADSARAAPAVRAGVALARADLAVQLNTLADAQRLYVRAEQLYRQAGEPAGEAEALQGRGLLLLARDETLKARVALEAAHRGQLAAGHQRAAALTRVLLAQVSRASGDTATARRELARAAMDLDHLGDPVAAASALGEWGSLESAAGRPAVAESLYRAGLNYVRNRVAPEVTWQLRSGLGLARRAQGATGDAARELRAAITEMERSSQSLVLPERRSGFLADKWDVYVQLALAEHAQGRSAAAFEASERLRGRETLELLARGRIVAPSDTAAALVVREQDLRRRIAELTRGLAGGSTAAESLRGPDVARVPGATREALLGAQEAYADLLLEIRERAPAHAAVVKPVTAAWEAVAARLAPDEAFIEYLVGDSATLAFVIVRDTVAVVSIAADRRALARLVEFTRGTLEPRGSASLDSLWRGPLRRLHQHLIAPVEATGLLTGKPRLVLVPHAELQYLPFAALLDGSGSGRFLVERYELTVTPSASVWLTLGDRRHASAGAGLLALAPRPDALPASRQDVAAIARRGGADALVLVARAATEEVFLREAPSRRVIHLATYGVLNRQNPLFSFVELGPGGRSDGRLEVHEVFGLSLIADLVVLSACQTAVGSGTYADVPAGDDWVGLTRAFLHAGAARVMATLWPVQDRATAVLMEQFYGAFEPGTDAARALTRAQRTLLTAPATAHPFYWAGLVLVGGSRAAGAP